MKLTLGQQVALSLRRRPLLLPLLLALAAVDMVAWWLVTQDSDWDVTIYWGLLIPQLGLLTVWSARFGAYWGTRLVAWGSYLVLLVLIQSSTRHSHQAAATGTVLLVYSALIGFAVVGGSLIAKRRSGATPRRDTTQYSMWHMLVVMTLVAVLSAAAPRLTWQLNPRENPILLGLIAIVLLAYFGSRFPPRPWVGFAFALLTALSFEWAYWSETPKTNGMFLATAVTSGLSCAAVAYRPDAKRRLAARRKRHAPRLTVVSPDPDAPSAPETPQRNESVDLNA